MLQETLAKKIPNWHQEIQRVLEEKGNTVISEVTVAKAYGGMRGIKGLTCETSAVSADDGLIIRGYPLLDICLLYTSPSPRDQRGSRMPSSA